MTPAYPTPARRLLITAATLASSTLVAVDMTIANVALPHMAPALSASQDQIVWVLTSYVIAGAIATPLSGWLADRYGRRLVMAVSVAGFTFASLLCGVANSLELMVLARLLQGACGAAIVPLSQATLFDINPPERHARAMALFSLGSMFGPLAGPTLGGWLTDSFSWRWVFFINLPVGIAAFAGMMAMGETRSARPARFDAFGFATVSIALGAFQLMIDRGEHVGWFESTEIWIYATVLGLSAYLTAVHLATARDTFIRPALFRDRNFAIGNLYSAVVGIALFATLPIIVMMMQTTLGYSALHTGYVGMPRGIGTLIGMLLVARLIGRIDSRVLLASGLGFTAIGMHMYAGLSIYTDERILAWAGLIQGMGSGFMFLPLSLMVFATLPGEFRNEGAAMYALTRNIGQAVGISLVQREYLHYAAASRSELGEAVRPDNPMLAANMPEFDFASTEAVARMAREVARQAAMVANIEVYALSALLCAASIPLVVFMRAATRHKPGEPLPVME